MEKSISFLLLLIFTLIFFIYRIPAYDAPLIHEEGMLANIFYTKPVNPKYLQIARIDGVDWYTNPQHPAFLYEILGIIGSVWKGIINTQDFNPKELSVLVRVAISTIQYCFFLIILLIILPLKGLEWNNKLATALLIAAITISVPAIKMSVSVQIDGSVGVLLSGILSIAIITYALKTFPKQICNFFLFLGSIIFGFGKNEWSLALLVSIILSTIFILIGSHKMQFIQERKSWFSFLGIIFIGLIIGNIISFLFDSVNYLAGFGVMFRFSKASTFFNVLNMIKRASYTYVNILILFFLFFALIRSIRKPDFFLFFIFTFSTMMFVAYFVISWATDPRYYAPSLAIGSAGLVLAADYFPAKISKPLILVLTSVILLHSTVFFYNRLNTIQNYLTLNTYTEYTLKQPACIPVTNSGSVFGTKMDFITDTISLDAAKSLAENASKELCK